MIRINFKHNAENGAAPSSNAVFRHYKGEEDLKHILEIAAESQNADKLEDYTTLEQLTLSYQSFHHCDVFKDICFIEMDGKPVAYARTEWDEEATGNIVFSSVAHVKPAWRKKGLGTALLHWIESRAREIAIESHAGRQCFLSAFTDGRQAEKCALLEKNGFQVMRNFYEMNRPLASLPEIKPLPTGISVRPVKADETHQVWQAANEFFRGHYGYVEPREEDFTTWQKMEAYYQPDLWQVAWRGDEVVGSVMNFINHGENKTFNRKRGYTENISVHPDLRGQGIASGLIVRSMHMHKAMGMDEVALGVDTDNATGALRLYENLGYKLIHQSMDYRKPVQ